jgi:hypothetical protein
VPEREDSLMGLARRKSVQSLTDRIKAQRALLQRAVGVITDHKRLADPTLAKKAMRLIHEIMNELEECQEYALD